MQRIERYGVIALVLLLVTIAAVSFWDDGGAKTSNPKSKREAAVAQHKKALSNEGKRAKNVRVGNQDLPVTSKKGEKSKVAPANSGPATSKAASVGSSPEEPGRSWLSRRNQPRKSTKESFETLPATVANGREVPAENRDSGNNSGNEVEFPDSLSRESGAQPIASEFGRAKSAVERDTPYSRAEETQTKAARNDAQKPKAQGSRGTYTVRAGDTLSQIAERELGSSRRWSEIQALNGGIDPGSIYEGMVLRLPSGSASAGSLRTIESPQSVDFPPKTSVAGSYTVRPGDSLSQIAQDHLGGASRWKEIVAFNPGIDPDRLIVGDKLRLPAGSSRSSVGSLTASATPAPRARKKNRVR